MIARAGSALPLLSQCQGSVDGLRLVRAQDGAAIGDEGVRRPVPLDRRLQHAQVRRQVLGAGDDAREDRPGVVAQDGDDVHSTAQPVVVHLADVRALELVTSCGLKGYLPFLLGRPLGLLQAVELPVEGEDTP